MKKKLTKITGTALFSILFAYGIITHSSECTNAVRYGISTCVKTVIPSLFPFFILSGIIVDTGLAACIGKPVKRIMMTLFKTNGACASALILGLIGGYPIGATCAVSLYEKKLCTKTEAERLLAFCNNSGPGFTIGVAGAGVFGDVKIGIVLYGVHMISCIITGIVFRFYKRSEKACSSHSTVPSVTCSLPSSFTSSVKSAVHSCINVSAFVVSFSVIITLLDTYNLFKPFTLLPASFSDLGRQICIGLLEVTNGLTSLAQCSGSIPSHIIISSFLIGWAGVSVHFQTFSIINKKLSIKPYIIGKALHAVISAIIMAIILKTNIINNSQLTFAPSIPAKSSLSFVNSGIAGAAAGAFMLLAIFLLIIFYEISQNDWKNIRK